MPLTFKHHQLKNGLDIIAEINPDSHSVSAGMFVKTGARDESMDVNGVSHFLEPMMFKGSEKYTWEDVNRIFDEIGARYNAATSQEMTSYYANVLPEYTEQAVEHLSQNYTWEDVNRIFDEIGARYNAATSQEMTSYYANVLPEYTEQAVEHLSHLLRPAIRESDFTTEKKVILEEIAMYLDDPGHRLYEELMSTHFGDHPLARSILGPAQAI